MRVRGARLSRRVAAVAVTAAFACATPPTIVAEPVRGEVRVRAVRPHDPGAFTQGLLWHQGRLYETVGGYGRSALREVEPESGRVVREVRLPGGEFAEGLALVGDRLVQLTWREGIARVWRRDDFSHLATFRYQGEGWGLTYDGRDLIQSDGSAKLQLRSPDDFALRRTLAVTRAGRAAAFLNELEWAAGSIYANVWYSDEIVRIDPASGEVRAVFDASGLLPPDERARADVLNGIAYDPERRLFLLTGKLWPSLFEVELLEPAP